MPAGALPNAAMPGRAAAAAAALRKLRLVVIVLFSIEADRVRRAGRKVARIGLEGHGLRIGLAVDGEPYGVLAGLQALGAAAAATTAAASSTTGGLLRRSDRIGIAGVARRSRC